jgi:hypothetical protein
LREDKHNFLQQVKRLKMEKAELENAVVELRSEASRIVEGA